MDDWLPPSEAKVVWAPPSEAKVAERVETIEPQHPEERPDPRVTLGEGSEEQPEERREPRLRQTEVTLPLALGEAITTLLRARPVQAPDGTSGRPHWCRPRHAPGPSGRRLR